MVKLVDTTLPFADVVACHRREQAGAAAAHSGFRPQPTTGGLSTPTSSRSQVLARASRP
jgi:hypothetical protein